MNDNPKLFLTEITVLSDCNLKYFEIRNERSPPENIIKINIYMGMKTFDEHLYNEYLMNMKTNNSR